MIIHRFWVGTPLPRHDWTGTTMQTVHDIPVKTWTPRTLPRDIYLLIANLGGPRTQSNVARYALLHRFGGLWVDNDVIPLQRLTDSPTPWTAALKGRREGCVIWFPEPEHPMLSALLTTIPQRPWHGQSVSHSGAHVLHDVGERFPDVGMEPRVIPHDSRGRWTGITNPLAVHLWETSP